MHIPGHIAVGLIQLRLSDSLKKNEGIVKPLLIASLFPDFVDKSIGYIFHLMPNGRHFSHNIFSVIFLSSIVSLIWGKVAGLGWLLGHLGHLLADSGEMVPWLFPFKKYLFKRGSLIFRPAQFFRELLLLALVFAAYRKSR